jgi:hypothetical protein
VDRRTGTPLGGMSVLLSRINHRRCVMQVRRIKGLRWITELSGPLAVIAVVLGASTPGLLAQGGPPPKCDLENAVYLSPENWLCLGGECGGGYCCLICTPGEPEG